MKSIAFLRNTWKKWEQKAFDTPEDPQMNMHRQSQKPAHPRLSASTGRTLTVTVKHMPLEDTTASFVEGSWQSSNGYQPPSPVYDQFTRNRSERTLVRRDSSRFNLDDRAHGALFNEECRTSSSSRPTSPQSVHVSTSSTHASRRSKGAVHGKPEVSTSGSSPTRARPASPPSSPRCPTLPSFQLLQPMDLDDYGPVNNSPEGKSCRCGRLQSKHHSDCPKFSFHEAQGSMEATKMSDSLQSSPKTVNAILDLPVDAKRRSLYHTTGSMPHLPYKERSPPSVRSERSTCSAESSDMDHFPLSLFPTPPPLMVRKKIPAPLILRTALPASSPSSRDSTPVGTPTTPRFQPLSSPSQSSIASPTKKYIARSTASISPPSFSPPNSPLPSLPISPGATQRTAHHAGHLLRSARSNTNLRVALPFPVTHRLSSSEPISDQSSLPIRKLANQRFDSIRAKDLQSHMDVKEQTAITIATDTQVQWGYAL